MSSLGDKNRKARESVLDFNGHKITVRRPTELQFGMWAGLPTDEWLRRIVVSYSGPASSQINDRGRVDGKEIFDPDAFAEWVGDQLEVIEAITSHIMSEADKRTKAVGDHEKKS